MSYFLRQWRWNKCNFGWTSHKKNWSFLYFVFDKQKFRRANWPHWNRRPFSLHIIDNSIYLRVARSPILPFYAKLSFVCPIFQANNATLNVRIGPTVKAARNVATVKTEAVVTTFQELVLAHQDGKELCKFFFFYFLLFFHF